MNEFLEKLVALRSGIGRTGRKIGDVAGETIGNMTNVGDRMKQMDEAKRARNMKMINENFGGYDNYEKMNQENPLPTSGLGDFFRRVLNSRQK